MTKPVGDLKRPTEPQFILDYVAKFTEKEPSEEEFTEFLQEKYGTTKFRSLKIGSKLDRVLAFHDVQFKDGKVCVQTFEELKTIILVQMEFYFSDGNLPRDNFLLELVTQNAGRWVKLETFLKFKMILRRVDNVENLAKCVEDSETLEMNETRTEIRRKVKCTWTLADFNKCLTYVKGLQAPSRSAFMKNFKTELKKYGTVLAVFHRPRRRAMKGSDIEENDKIEVVWSSEEEAKNFSSEKQRKFGSQTFEINLFCPTATSESNEIVRKEKTPEEQTKFIVLVKNLPEDVSFKALKQHLEVLSEKNVAFVKVQGTDAIVRLDSKQGDDCAKIVVEKCNKQTFQDSELEVALVPESDMEKVVAALARTPPTGRGRGRGRGRKKLAERKGPRKETET